jgi:hypothetical protein
LSVSPQIRPVARQVFLSVKIFLRKISVQLKGEHPKTTGDKDAAETKV